MKLTLNDLASIAQIVSVPLILLTWLVTRERLAQFWGKHFEQILGVTVVLAILGMWRLGWPVKRERFEEFLKKHLKPILAVTAVLAILGIWRLGWLEWLQIEVSWPIWGLLLCSVIPVVIVLALTFLYPRKTAKPQDELTYHTIDLPKYNTHLSRHEAPQGTTWLGGVKFYIPNEYDSVHHYYIPKGIKVQPSPSNESQVEQIKIDLPNITYVWFLVVAGSGYKKSPENVKFEDRQIGYIELVFNKGSPQKVSLVLGANIREWDCYLEEKREDLVRSLADKAAREVWRHPEGYSVLDMLQVAVKGGPKYLARIRIVGEFGEEVELAYLNFPSVNVYAITCGQAPS